MSDTGKVLLVTAVLCVAASLALEKRVYAYCNSNHNNSQDVTQTCGMGGLVATISIDATAYQCVAPCKVKVTSVTYSHSSCDTKLVNKSPDGTALNECGQGGSDACSGTSYNLYTAAEVTSPTSDCEDFTIAIETTEGTEACGTCSTGTALKSCLINCFNCQ